MNKFSLKTTSLIIGSASFIFFSYYGCTKCSENNNIKTIENHTTNDSFQYKHLTNPMTNTEKEILAVVKEWNKSFANNDVKIYFSYIHQDLTLFIPSSPYRIDGKNDDKEEFEWSLSKSRTKVHFFQELQPQVQVYGNTAIVTYYNRGAYGPDGNEQIHYLKETNVLTKENDKWKIVHIHTSK